MPDHGFSIRLNDDTFFENPEARIREYCEVEIYRGYDDKHSINNAISRDDIDAANNLYAMIDRYDNLESKRLLMQSEKIREAISKVPNQDIFAIQEKDWSETKADIKSVLQEFLSVRGIGLAKATKILHLKRPNLFPVLDSFVVKFLLGIDIVNVTDKNQQIEIGLQALELVRKVISDQREAFKSLTETTKDLPIPLTSVRLFDILCWTAEKWDKRKSLNAPYGSPHKSLLHTNNSIHSAPAVGRKIEDMKGQYVVFEDRARASGPKIHSVDCTYYQRWLGHRTTTTTWHGPYASEEEAWRVCRNIASRQNLEPSRHSCVDI